jgi:hypothetical protein
MARHIAIFLIVMTVFCRVIYLYAPIRGEDDVNANRKVLRFTDGVLFLSAIYLIYTYYAEWLSL